MSQIFYLCFIINLIVSVSTILDKRGVPRIVCRKYKSGVFGQFLILNPIGLNAEVTIYFKLLIC